MDVYITASGLTTKKTVEEYKYGQMVHVTKDNGVTIEQTDTDEWYMQKATSMKENGLMTKQMEKELYEYLLYSGQQEFYNDMMAERRIIRQARIDQAVKKSERKRFWFDLLVGGAAVCFGLGIIIGLFMVIL